MNSKRTIIWTRDAFVRCESPRLDRLAEQSGEFSKVVSNQTVLKLEQLQVLDVVPERFASVRTGFSDLILPDGRVFTHVNENLFIVVEPAYVLPEHIRQQAFFRMSDDLSVDELVVARWSGNPDEAEGSEKSVDGSCGDKYCEYALDDSVPPHLLMLVGAGEAFFDLETINLFMTHHAVVDELGNVLDEHGHIVADY